MEVFQDTKLLREYLTKHRKRGQNIGFVPTMGALHDGHLSLVEHSLKNNHHTVVSIFVNPAQFNDPKDLLKYPRTLEEDIKLLKKVGAQTVFCPDETKVYPEKPEATISFPKLEKNFEGKYRPGHFSGVAIVVAKLFNMVQPNNAYFGQKDWQQFSIIKKMASDLSFNVNINSVPTVREGNMLAMSSRNKLLTEDNKCQATIFYKSLRQAREQLLNGQEILSVKRYVQNLFDRENVQLEYFDIVDKYSLEPIKSINQKDNIILLIAGYVNRIRLIDNLFLGDHQNGHIL